MRSEPCRGSILVMGVITVAVLGLLGLASVRMLETLMRESLWQARLSQALYIAEAGAEDALRRLAEDGAWRAGYTLKSFAGGSYSVSVTTNAIPTIKVTGYAKPMKSLGSAFKTLSFRARALAIPQMMYAAHSNTRITFNGASTVDSYDSSVNTDPLIFGSIGDVRSNAQLVIDLVGVAVNGNATYVSGSAPPSGTVTGTVTQTTQTATVPVESGTGYATDYDNLTGIQPQSVYNTANRHVLVPLGSTATIRSGVYYLDKTDINGTLTLEITDGPVVIFLTNAIDVAATGALVNPTKIPANLIIYSDSTKTDTFGSLQKLHAILVGQNTDINVNQEIYGALAADKIIFDGVLGKLHYDLSLRNPKVYATSKVADSWQGLPGRL